MSMEMVIGVMRFVKSIGRNRLRICFIAVMYGKDGNHVLAAVHRGISIPFDVVCAGMLRVQLFTALLMKLTVLRVNVCLIAEQRIVGLGRLAR